MGSINRRRFLQIGAGCAGAVAVGPGLVNNWYGKDAPFVQDPRTDGDRVVATFCELCFWKCGVLAHVKDGVVTKIEGNPDHPLSRGKLCPRGTGGTGLLYDPDRLKRPLIRVKKRGEEVFEEVSWDVALDKVAEGMKKLADKYGPQSLALFSHGFGGSWFKHLVKSYGTPNIGAPSYAQCRGPREAGFEATFGSGLGSPEPIDMANAGCITLIGSHLGENMHNTQVQDMSEAIRRGADIIVVDPRYSTAAGKAKHWLPIKPGTDIALLLAWMNVIITEKLYDAEYIAKHAKGFDELASHVADKTPEWAHPRTGLDPAAIRKSARTLAAARPASLIHPGRRTTWYGDDTQRLRAVAMLNALLGSYGRRGGFYMGSSVEVPKYKTGAYPLEGIASADRKGDGQFPMAGESVASGLRDAVTEPGYPYPIKGWMVYGSNLIQSLPSSAKTIEAISKLDFIVAVDVLPSEICGWADVVLPECTYLERADDLWNPSYKEPFVAMRNPAVAPMYDSKPGWWIAKELGNRLGLGSQFPWKDADAYLRHRVSAAGLSFEDLKRKGVVSGKAVPCVEEEGLALSFDTPSGKIELKSDAMEALGFHAMPQFTPPEEPPAGMFRLLFGRAPSHTFGRTVNNRFLAQVYPENEVWINRTAAAALPGFVGGSLATGTPVVLVNQDGVRSNPVKVRVTERIRGDCVYMVHGFGHTAKGLSFARGKGASDSELITRYKVDPTMGGTGMNGNFVRIEKVEKV